MTDITRKFNRDNLEFEFNVFDGVVYYARSPNDFLFLNNSNVMSLLFASASLDYSVGEKNFYKSSDLTYNSKSTISNLFVEKINQGKKKDLDSKVKLALTDLMGVRSVDNYDSQSDYYYLEQNWDHLSKTYSGVFSLSEGELYRIKTEVIPAFTKRQLEDVKGIGKLLRKYVNQYLNEKN